MYRFYDMKLDWSFELLVKNGLPTQGYMKTLNREHIRFYPQSDCHTPNPKFRAKFTHLWKRFVIRIMYEMLSLSSENLILLHANNKGVGYQCFCYSLAGKYILAHCIRISEILPWARNYNASLKLSKT